MEQKKIDTIKKVALTRKVKGVTILDLNGKENDNFDLLIGSNEMLVFKNIKHFERRLIGTNGNLAKQNKGIKLDDILQMKFFKYQKGYNVLAKIMGQAGNVKRTFTTGRLLQVFCFDNEVEPTAEGIEGTFYAFHRDGNQTETKYTDHAIRFDGLIVKEEIDLSKQMEEEIVATTSNDTEQESYEIS